MSEQNQQPEVAAEEQQEAVLQIQRIYVKDVSFEAPNLPHIFHQEWKPKLGFDLSTEAVQVGEDLYEVTLNINVETTMEDYFTFMSSDIKSVEVLGNIYESKELLNE